MSAKYDDTLLIAYILDELSADERARVDAQLKTSPTLRKKLEELSLVHTRLTADAADPAVTADEDAFLIELNNRIEEGQARPAFGALRWLAAGGAFILILLMISQRPAPVTQGPHVTTSPTPSVSSTTLRLAKHTPAVYPDFSGLSETRAGLAGKAPSMTPGPMPAFPATPKMTKGVSITFPQIKL